MTYVKMKELTEKLSTLILQPFIFDGLKITVTDVIHAKHPKNWLISEHFHPWFEFNYVAKGSLYTTIEGTEFLVTKGESYIIPPGVSHAHRHNKEGDDGICIRFSLQTDKENEIMNVLNSPHFVPFRSNIEQISLQGGLKKLSAEFASWLMGLYDLWSENDRKPMLSQNTFAAQVELYLKEYCDERLKTEDIASAMNVSYRTLARRFKLETGLSVSERLCEIRLDKAKKMLLSTDFTVYKIAQSCGFESEFYFSRHFKKKEGVSPTRYRAQNRIADL